MLINVSAYSPYWPKNSSFLHLKVGLRPRVYYTLTNFKGGGGKAPFPPLPQYANDVCIITYRKMYCGCITIYFANLLPN